MDVFDMLFGCWHKNYSFPITAKNATRNGCHAADLTGTYVVCLDCGKEFPYDWENMKVLSVPTGAAVAPRAAASVAGLEKIA